VFAVIAILRYNIHINRRERLIALSPRNSVQLLRGLVFLRDCKKTRYSIH